MYVISSEARNLYHYWDLLLIVTEISRRYTPRNDTQQSQYHARMFLAGIQSDDQPIRFAGCWIPALAGMTYKQNFR